MEKGSSLSSSSWAMRSTFSRNARATLNSTSLLLPGIKSRQPDSQALWAVVTAASTSDAPALATSLYPESERTKALAGFAASQALAAAIGPLLSSGARAPTR